eukprot:7030342-Pyramimonas_sp.AAC.2
MSTTRGLQASTPRTAIASQHVWPIRADRPARRSDLFDRRHQVLGVVLPQAQPIDDQVGKPFLRRLETGDVQKAIEDGHVEEARLLLRAARDPLAPRIGQEIGARLLGAAAAEEDLHSGVRHLWDAAIWSGVALHGDDVVHRVGDDLAERDLVRQLDVASLSSSSSESHQVPELDLATRQVALRNLLRQSALQLFHQRFEAATLRQRGPHASRDLAREPFSQNVFGEIRLEHAGVLVHAFLDEAGPARPHSWRRHPPLEEARVLH